MTVIRFTVPGTPVAKGRPRFTLSGYAYTPGKTRSYEKMVRMYATQAMTGKEMLKGAIKLSVTTYFPIPHGFKKAEKEKAEAGKLRHTKKPDWDNLGKLISDACNGIVYHDDAQVSDSLIYKRYSALPRTEIIIKEIER